MSNQQTKKAVSDDGLWNCSTDLLSLMMGQNVNPAPFCDFRLNCGTAWLLDDDTVRCDLRGL